MFFNFLEDSVNSIPLKYTMCYKSVITQPVDTGVYRAGTVHLQPQEGTLTSCMTRYFLHNSDHGVTGWLLKFLLGFCVYLYVLCFIYQYSQYNKRKSQTALLPHTSLFICGFCFASSSIYLKLFYLIICKCLV